MKKEAFKTTCSYCGVGCGIEMNIDSNGQSKLIGDNNHPVNKGKLCSKGMNLNYVVEDKDDRILYPEMRWSKDHPLQRVSWDQATDKVAKTFDAMIKRYGPDSVGLYVSGQCLTEEYYLANKLTKGYIGTNNIDTNSRLCMSSAASAYIKTIGEDSVPIAYDDIEIADCFLITGANPAWCHPILFQRIVRRKEYNPDVKIIVIDPRETDTCSIADLHLKIIPGTDVTLYMAIAKILIDKKWIKKDFIEKYTASFSNYKHQVSGIRLKEAAAYCGITLQELKTAAEIIGKSRRFISMWAMGLNQSINGVDKNIGLLNLHLLTGTIGEPGCGPFSLTGQPNAMGGREVGGMANLLAAHKTLSNATHRKQVENYWGCDEIQDKPGLTGIEMFDALEKGTMKAIWIICTNPITSLPNSNKIIKALKKAKLVVVQDISHKSKTTEYADVLLPAAGWTEKEGTMTNSERRISFLPKIFSPPGEAKPDAEIICTIARKMGFSGFSYNTTSDIYDEYCGMTKGTNIDISGLSHERLIKEGTFQWPVPHSSHPGTERLFEDKKFYTPTGKATFNLIKDFDLTRREKLSEDYPFILTTGRIRDQWHTMTRTSKVNKLNQHIPNSYLEIHPKDAESIGLKDKKLVVVFNGHGRLRVKVQYSTKIKRGTVFIPMHFSNKSGDGLNQVNNLFGDQYDPISKQPELKYTTVGIKEFVKRKEKICIVGAGSAAYRFVISYRELNKDDEIVVFSKEKDIFYNRVLLPEYTNSQLSWTDLQKTSTRQLEKLNVQVHYDCPIEKIDRTNNVIVDNVGRTHHYDKLIMATGSRPFLPPEVPIHLNGVFTIRNKIDADRLKVHIQSLSKDNREIKTVVAGGGLLGLEIAAALSHIDSQVSIVQRSSRLMERQLDQVGSELLAQEIGDRDIDLNFNNEIYTIFETSEGLQVTLKSGLKINSDIVVYAIGTVPNIGIAKSCDLPIQRGVIVNKHLQTADPNIYAIGEIAQFNEKLYGITAAAEEQADILAEHISGNPESIYGGSVLMNILKLDHVALCSIGTIPSADNKDNYEEIIYSDMALRSYKKCIIKNDRLVGAILIGDKSLFAEFRNLIENKIELSDKRSELILGRSNQKQLKGNLVCSCNNVGAGNLEDAIKNGCSDFKDLCQKTGAGLGCGSCKPEVNNILKQHLVMSS